MIIIVTTMTIMVIQVDFTTRLVYSHNYSWIFSPSILPSTVGENSVGGKARQQEISVHIAYSLISLYHATI